MDSHHIAMPTPPQKKKETKRTPTTLDFLNKMKHPQPAIHFDGSVPASPLSVALQEVGSNVPALQRMAPQRELLQELIVDLAEKMMAAANL